MGLLRGGTRSLDYGSHGAQKRAVEKPASLEFQEEF